MSRHKIWTIGFDADDTLWQNEQFFAGAQTRFAALLADAAGPDHLQERLLAAERRNLGHYGYGIKGFVLSMIETAIEVTDGRVAAPVIAEVLAMGREMLRHPVHLLPGVAAAITALSDQAELVLITKGDLLDQERKLAASGLGDLFDAVEIVSDKSAVVYARIFSRHGRAQAMMVGNSLRSDVIPALDAGAWGVHVPHPLTWGHEAADQPRDHPRFRQIGALADLPALVATIGTSSP